MATVKANGVELYYEERGSGPPLLLMLGTGACIDLWTPVIDRLARSYRVIAYDRRGFGRSSTEPRARIADHAVDASALLVSLEASPAAVVGWSAGGAIALDLAATFPESVTELFLAEPAVHVATHPRLGTLMMQAQSWARRYLRRDTVAAAQTMYRWASSHTTGGNAYDRLPQEWRDQMTGHAASTVREMDQLILPYPSRAAIRSITCPVTVIEGDLSDPAFRAIDAFVLRLLPRARLISLAGAAHFLHIDQPDTWVDAIVSA